MRESYQARAATVVHIDLSFGLCFESWSTEMIMDGQAIPVTNQAATPGRFAGKYCIGKVVDGRHHQGIVSGCHGAVCM